jgi:diketogulonate reductase-like aldo/keto reductase
VDLGLARSIGVSNFNVQSLWDLTSYARIPPCVNEVEIHPLYNQEGLVRYCLDHHILPLAYSSLARASNTIKKKGTANVLETELIQTLAAKYARLPTQVVLNWAVVGRGYAVIPKSATFDRQRDNLVGVTDFRMDEADYTRITTQLHDGSKICKMTNYDLWA